MKHPHNSPWHTYKLKSKYSPSTFVAATAREETRDDNVGEMYEATAHELLADVKTVQVVINSHLNRQGCTVLSERFRNAIGNRACAILRFGVMMHWRLVNRMMYWRLVNRMMHWRLVDALASS